MNEKLNIPKEFNDDLPFLLFWRNINGTPMFENYQTFKGAMIRLEYLKKLNYIVKIFMNIGADIKNSMANSNFSGVDMLEGRV